MANSIKYGLKNVYYAVANYDGTTLTWGTPVHIPGAVSASLSPEGEMVEFYADDRIYYSENVNNGYSGTLELAYIPDSFRTAVLGDSVDSNGALIENSADDSNYIALMFEFKNDAKATRHALYYVKVSRTDVASNTKGNTTEPVTETLNLRAYPDPVNGNVKVKLQYGDTGYSAFFSAVYTENAPVNTVAQSAVLYDKSSDTDLTIDVTSTGIVAVTNVKLDGTLVPGVSLGIANPDVTILEAYMNTVANGVHTLLVEYDKGNAVEIALTVQE